MLQIQGIWIFTKISSNISNLALMVKVYVILEPGTVLINM